MLNLGPSPVSKATINGLPLFIKRDDLLHPQFSGNKARKFYSLLHSDLRKTSCLFAYGSVQANSLYSLAALAQLKHCQLKFYVQRIPRYLKNQPNGNYHAALALGAQIIEAPQETLQTQPSLGEYVKTLAHSQANSLFIPEGGRSIAAQVGVHLLGAEIEAWRQLQQHSQLIVMLPSGTGTTALFLQQYCQQQQLPIDVWTCACVGGNDYLQQQFLRLEPDSTLHPTILSPQKKYHFGKLYPQLLTMWQQVQQQSGIEFDLLYDPLAWQCLFKTLELQPAADPILYIHQGGLLGNESMLARYRRKYPHYFSD